MEDLRFAVMGIGATGTMLAAALLKKDPESVLVGSRSDPGKILVL
jgi:ketopantoate reductase